MSETGIEVLERLRGKPLSAEEREMFIRMGKEFDCAENDAVWKIMAVMEYQKSFYVDMPRIIMEKTDKIIGELGKAAEKEVAIAQGKLVEGVVAEAKKLNLKSQTSTLILMGLATLILFFLTCSLMMWAGYRLGSGGTQLPEVMFRLPSGLMIGLLLLGCGAIFSYWAVKEYSDETKSLWRPLAGALASIALGSLAITVSF